MRSLVRELATFCLVVNAELAPEELDWWGWRFTVDDLAPSPSEEFWPVPDADQYLLWWRQATGAVGSTLLTRSANRWQAARLAILAQQ